MPRSSSSKIYLHPAVELWKPPQLFMLCYLYIWAIFLYVLKVKADSFIRHFSFAEKSFICRHELMPDFVDGSGALMWLSTLYIHQVLSHEKSNTFPLYNLFKPCSIVQWFLITGNSFEIRMRILPCLLVLNYWRAWKKGTISSKACYWSFSERLLWRRVSEILSFFLLIMEAVQE